MTRQRAPNGPESVRVRTLEDAIACIVHVRERLTVVNAQLTQRARTAEDADVIRELRATFPMLAELQQHVLESHPNRRQ